MIDRAIIMSGGEGSRMRPLTYILNKHLLPIYDKPLIYYPLSLMMLLKIKKYLIIINKGDKKNFEKILGNGKHLGLDIKYIEQDKPRGIPDAFILGKEFIKNKNFFLILGDNIFFGQGLIEIIKKNMNLQLGAKIFCYPVNNPRDFGVIKYKKNKILKIIEKPKKFISDKAITGLYIFDKNVYEIAKNLKPSSRNETEITDVLKKYLKLNKLKFYLLGRGSSWLDAGTIKNSLNCSNFINIIEERQNYKIACIEEISFKNKWINKNQLNKLIKKMGKCEYSEYLKKI